MIKPSSHQMLSWREAQQIRDFFAQHPHPPRRISHQLLQLVIGDPALRIVIGLIVLGLLFLAYQLNDPNLSPRRQFAYLLSVGGGTMIFTFLAIGGMVHSMWVLCYGVYGQALVLAIRPNAKSGHYDVTLRVQSNSQEAIQSIILIVPPHRTITQGATCEVMMHPQRLTIWWIFSPPPA